MTACFGQLRTRQDAPPAKRALGFGPGHECGLAADAMTPRMWEF